ncbi:MAG TPA: branched-chain amino acid ABC transporter permease [Acidimicrobiia bacterium]|jgi:branched-chain amino acid transport system permease protein|nr:branched-chain amino acid transport system permease protein [Actinomycetota bacterium]MDQ1506744.1 branched-chain amino acid transport system permease protein [Actinomycetota bacterium]
MPTVLSRSALTSTAIAVGLAAALVATGSSQALVIGIITGAGYGLVALGLVLVYKSSGVFNFAQGEFGTVAIYALYRVHDKIGIPLIPAIVIALAASVAMALATERLVIRRLFDAPRVALLVATAGVALLAISLELWLGEARPRFIQPALGRLNRLSLFDVAVSDQRMLVLAALVILALVLALFFSRTNLGLAILGVSQEPVATELMGISVRRLSSFIWALTGLLAGIAGILTAPVAGSFAPGFLTSTALIPGFTAAVLGGMKSLPGAFVGGIVVGVAQSLAVSSPAFHSIPGAGSVMIFALLLVVLTVRPQGLLGKA